MKAVKYLMIGALALSISGTAMAQEDSKAIVSQITSVIKSKPADLESQVKAVFKKNKKNPEVLVGIGRAFLDVKDTLNARTYAEHALKASKNKSADAFLLLGDISVLGTEDGGAAAEYYSQAIHFDPANPEAYYKYANIYRKTSPTMAVDKLNELRAHRPDVAVDAMAGHIYYASNEFEKAIECFKKADRKLMTESQLKDYAMALYFTRKYAETLDVCKFGLENKNRRDAAYNRLAFFSSTELKDFDNALVYADALFNKSDSAKLSYFDYSYYGNAYSGKKQFADAINMYKKALTMEFDQKEKRAGIAKQLSHAYRDNGDFENAVASYKEYLNDLNPAPAEEFVGLAQIYIQHGDTLQDEARMEAFRGAENVYIEMEQKFPDAAEFVTFMRARVNSYMDPETKDGLAKPFYEKIISIIEPKAEKTTADNARLVEAYRYIGYYLLINDKQEESYEYWNKILAIDPENPQAKQALTLQKKK